MAEAHGSGIYYSIYMHTLAPSSLAESARNRGLFIFGGGVSAMPFIKKKPTEETVGGIRIKKAVLT